jgi:hypothetical protein
MKKSEVDNDEAPRGPMQQAVKPPQDAKRLPLCNGISRLAGGGGPRNASGARKSFPLSSLYELWRVEMFHDGSFDFTRVCATFGCVLRRSTTRDNEFDSRWRHQECGSRSGRRRSSAALRPAAF